MQRITGVYGRMGKMFLYDSALGNGTRGERLYCHARIYQRDICKSLVQGTLTRATTEKCHTRWCTVAVSADFEIGCEYVHFTRVSHMKAKGENRECRKTALSRKLRFNTLLLTDVLNRPGRFRRRIVSVSRHRVLLIRFPTFQGPLGSLSSLDFLSSLGFLNCYTFFKVLLALNGNYHHNHDEVH